MERAANSLAEEAKRLDDLADQGLRRIDAAMSNAGARSTQLAAAYTREADRVKEAADGAATALSRVVDSLREAGASAQALIADSTADAKRRSKDFVGEAMGQCDHLIKAASSVAEEAEKARSALTKAAEEAERHIIALPGVAKEEAERVRETLRQETEQMLDISARTLATLQSRIAGRRQAEEPPLPRWRRLRRPARRAGRFARAGAAHHRYRQEERRGNPGPRSTNGFELSQVLAAAENAPTRPAGNGQPRRQRSGNGTGGEGAKRSERRFPPLKGRWPISPSISMRRRRDTAPRLWRRYLDGDRTAFARKLAHSIGPETVDRIASLYRDNRASAMRRTCTCRISRRCSRGHAKATAMVFWPRPCSGRYRQDLSRGGLCAGPARLAVRSSRAA